MYQALKAACLASQTQLGLLSHNECWQLLRMTTTVWFIIPKLQSSWDGYWCFREMVRRWLWITSQG